MDFKGCTIKGSLSFKGTHSYNGGYFHYLCVCVSCLMFVVTHLVLEKDSDLANPDKLSPPHRCLPFLIEASPSTHTYRGVLISMNITVQASYSPSKRSQIKYCEIKRRREKMWQQAWKDRFEWFRINREICTGNRIYMHMYIFSLSHTHTKACNHTHRAFINTQSHSVSVSFKIIQW